MFYWAAHAHFFLCFCSFLHSACISCVSISLFHSSIHSFNHFTEYESVYRFCCYYCLSASAWCCVSGFAFIHTERLIYTCICICTLSYFVRLYICIVFVCCMHNQHKLLKSVAVIQPINFRCLVLIRNDLPHWRDLTSTWALLTIG